MNIEIRDVFVKTSDYLFLRKTKKKRSIQKSTKICKTSEHEAKAMPREARVHWCRIEGRPGEALPGLKGGTPPGPSQGCDLGGGPPRELLFPMPIFASISDDLLVTC